ncbi:drebrin isoform X2 [Denticeps clupeoides]|uniref:drebrin isoform X2 n=1 Tax=Denticeps clupeoides TaxID=299321 RepID=UPI0010A338AD|nr:drebrin isoform X2 [Denticeps clupeoides]
MAVNLSKNRLALLTAYQDVINESTSTDWALYTYEGGDANDLTVGSSGDGGLAEITNTFDNSCIMYGFCSLKEPTAALPHYILINWVGEDVPDARKCACASHVATIAEFFQGVGVIINASSMEDIDPSAIGQRLTNGTVPVASPVLSRLHVRDEGTTYQKTNAEIEMKKINREEFWEQAKREEELRKEEEKRKAAEERQRFEEERMELERKEQEDRERRYRERERQIEEHRKKMQEEEEAKDRTRGQPQILKTEPSHDDPTLEKKESEVEEAAAIIAQRTENPREFFKLREKAGSISKSDNSPGPPHRAGRLDSPFLKQQHSPCEPSPPPTRAAPPVRPQPGLPDDVIDEISERNMTPVSPIPKIVTTPFQEDTDDASPKDWEPEPKQRTPVQESTPPRPVQSVAPQIREEEPVATETDNLLDLWESSPAPASAPSHAPHIMDLMEDLPVAEPAIPSSNLPRPLLSFDETPDPPVSSFMAEDDPASLVDVAGPDQMTLSYQQALEHASGSDSQDMDDGQLLMTNGDSLLKEGTQASEGYFSQSQEEEFGQSDECSAKVNPTPVFYNKPPEIDITCWDTDPVLEDDD